MSNAATLDQVDSVADFSMIGGQYKGRCGADGKYSILDIEIMSTHDKGENGVTVDVDEKWLRKTYANLVAQYPKHMIPINIFHHDDERQERPILVGYVQPTDIRYAFVKGKDRLTIFGNGVGIMKNNFQDILDVRLPFRSPQVLSFRQNQLGALSLLKDEIGYYMYPMLTIGSVEYAPGSKKESLHCSPLMSYKAASDNDDSGSFFYSYGGNSVKTEDGPIMEIKVGEAEISYAFDKKKESSGKDSGAAEGKSDAPPFAKKEGDSANAAAAPGAPAAGVPPAGVPQNDAAGQAGVMAILAKIWKCVQHLEKTPTGDEVNGNKAPSQDKKEDPKGKDAGQEKDGGSGPAQDKSSGKEKEKKYSAEKEIVMSDAAEKVEAKDEKKVVVEKSVSDDAKYAATMDENEALKEKLSARDLEGDAIRSMTSEGYRLSKYTRERIGHYAARGSDALNEFISDYKKIAQKDPPRNADNPGTQKSDADASLPEEVLKYKATDAKEFAVRKSILPDFAEYQRTGGTMTLERFIASEKRRMASGGV